MNSSLPLEAEKIEALVKAAQSGDAESFGKIYDAFVNMIYRYVYYRVGESEAEDLTELIFLKTWENIRSYRRGEYRFSSWVFRIAHNIVVDHYRSQQPLMELHENFVDERRQSDATLRTHRRLEHEFLASAMKELKDSYRQILVLKYINDLTNEEISEVLQMSQAAVRILQFRALRTLRRILEERGYTGDDQIQQPKFVKTPVT